MGIFQFKISLDIKILLTLCCSNKALLDGSQPFANGIKLF